LGQHLHRDADGLEGRQIVQRCKLRQRIELGQRAFVQTRRSNEPSAAMHDPMRDQVNRNLLAGYGKHFVQELARRIGEGDLWAERTNHLTALEAAPRLAYLLDAHVEEASSGNTVDERQLDG